MHVPTFKWPIYLSIFSIYLRLYRPIYLPPTYLSLSLSPCPPYPSILPTVCLSWSLSTYLHLCLSTYLCIYLSICLSAWLSVCSCTKSQIKGTSAKARNQRNTSFDPTLAQPRRFTASQAFCSCGLAKDTGFAGISRWKVLGCRVYISKFVMAGHARCFRQIPTIPFGPIAVKKISDSQGFAVSCNIQEPFSLISA